jgi:hypothetical protein
VAFLDSACVNSARTSLCHVGFHRVELTVNEGTVLVVRSLGHSCRAAQERQILRRAPMLVARSESPLRRPKEPARCTAHSPTPRPRNHLLGSNISSSQGVLLALHPCLLVMIYCQFFRPLCLFVECCSGSAVSIRLDRSSSLATPCRRS